MAAANRLSEVETRFTDPRWRLNNLYTITDKHGKRIPFRTNTAQEQFLDDIWYLNVILKARQLGFTTLIDLLILDDCMFNSDVRAGIIAHTLDDAEVIFRDKVRFPYDQLPDGLKAANPATQDSAKTLTFRNNSSLRVGTSLRSGTLQKLHISEYGKICALYPKKAKEIRSGALNTVAAGQMIFIESTAEGKSGDFYNICQTSRKLAHDTLTKLDFRFHFFPWHRDPAYQMDPLGVEVDKETQKYFAELAQGGIDLTDAQKAWYAKKLVEQREDMKREYPTTPDEAFEAAIHGAYYAKEIARARREKRIANVPYDRYVPVHTSWDLGVSDATAIWFWQLVGREIHAIDYYEASGVGFDHYAEVLRERGYTYGTHYFPHDVQAREISTGRSRVATLRSLGIEPHVVPLHQVLDGINAGRRIFDRIWFDAEKTERGLEMLSLYRADYDEERGVFKPRPLHDETSHGADAYRTFAAGFDDAPEIRRRDRYRDRDRGRTPPSWVAA